MVYICMCTLVTSMQAYVRTEAHAPVTAITGVFTKYIVGATQLAGRTGFSGSVFNNNLL